MLWLDASAQDVMDHSDHWIRCSWARYNHCSGQSSLNDPGSKRQHADVYQLSITTYMVDAFNEFSASALAAVTMARSVGGAVVPLIGPLLYKQLDQGWGNTVFAIVTLVFSIVPVLMYRYGTHWRSMFTTDDLD